MHGTAEHVAQWNARKKKISVDFMKKVKKLSLHDVAT